MAPVAEKVESKTISPTEKEIVDPFKQAMIITEHKIRNLEKRKRKVEIYKENQQKGQSLNADQLSAVAKYSEVVTSLELAHDLRKQFEGIAAESARQQKLQAKKEASERAARDLAIVQSVLTLQDVLQTMGVDETRADFLAGRNDACLVTDAELGHLDALYDEVFPKRDEGAFSEQAALASERLLAVHEGKAREVAGTTCRRLKELVGRIAACGYLDNVKPPAADDGTIDVCQIEADVEMAYVEIGCGDSEPSTKQTAWHEAASSKLASAESNGVA